MQLGSLESQPRSVPCPGGPLGPKGNGSPGQVGTGTCPRRALDPFPGERAGELADHRVSAADRRGPAGFVRRKLHGLMYLHLNGLALRLFLSPLAETGMSGFPALSVCVANF